MTVFVNFFYKSKRRDFKSYFPKALSYIRFIEFMKCVLIPLLLYTIKYGSGKCNGLNFIDYTPLIACKYQRRYSNKVMKDFAGIGKSSTE